MEDERVESLKVFRRARFNQREEKRRGHSQPRTREKGVSQQRELRPRQKNHCFFCLFSSPPVESGSSGTGRFFDGEPAAALTGKIAPDNWGMSLSSSRPSSFAGFWILCMTASEGENGLTTSVSPSASRTSFSLCASVVPKRVGQGRKGEGNRESLTFQLRILWEIAVKSRRNVSSKCRCCHRGLNESNCDDCVLGADLVPQHEPCVGFRDSDQALEKPDRRTSRFCEV